MSKGLYLCNATNIIAYDNKDFCDNYEILVKRWMKTKTMKSRLYLFTCFVLTLGKVRIYTVEKDGELVHYSYCIPKCFLFPFMGGGRHRNWSVLD